MRIRLEASPEELAAKGNQLLEVLARSLEPHHRGLSDALQKAIVEADQDEQPELRYPVLRELHERTRTAYAAQLDAMLRDINRVLDASSEP